MTRFFLPVRAWLREPAVHFLLIGGFLFGLSVWIGPPDEDRRGHVIVITAAQVEELRLSWRLEHKREPSPSELKALLADWVRDEVLYREALWMGLDIQDDRIRDHLIRKLIDTRVDGDTLNSPPSDDELRKFVERHPDRYRRADKSSPGVVARASRDWQRDRFTRECQGVYEHIKRRYQVVLPAQMAVESRP